MNWQLAFGHWLLALGLVSLYFLPALSFRLMSSVLGFSIT